MTPIQSSFGRFDAFFVAVVVCGAWLMFSGCSNSDSPPVEAGLADATPDAASVAVPDATASAPQQAAGERPEVGQTALDFTLATLAGQQRALADLTAKGPVVLLVMRGWVGYQCPICSRQFGEYLTAAGDFSAAGAQIVLVYPGPAEELALRAGEFYEGHILPDHFTVLLDPDMKFTSSYGLRWDAPQETAYPATIVISQDKIIDHVTISDSHGGRASAAEILKIVAK